MLLCFYLCAYIIFGWDTFVVGAEVSGKHDRKPHIVLIVADDLGFNDVPWHNQEVVAPNLDRLARQGIILENSYVQPICSPSRSALMTGVYPFAIGRQRSVIWPLCPTGLTLDYKILPQYLKPLGYATHAIGKWHLGFCNWNYTPTRRGFDTFRGHYTGSETYFTHMRSYRGSTGYDYRNNEDPYFRAWSTYSTYDFASHFEDLIESSNPDQPQFFYMPFQSVHSPLEVPKNYTKPYAHIKNRNRRTYLGMVSALDEAVGRIERALKKSKYYDNSVIIFTTDNGGSTSRGGNNWPLRGNKTTLWEGGTRGAAFIHSPLLENPGTISKNLIHICDWLATIVKLAGGEVPEDLDSLDQWEALQRGGLPPRRELIYNMDATTYGMQAAIRLGNHKLIVGNPGPGDWTPPPELMKDVNAIYPFEEFNIPDKLYSGEVGDQLWEKRPEDCRQNQSCIDNLIKDTKVETEFFGQKYVNTNDNLEELLQTGPVEAIFSDIQQILLADNIFQNSTKMRLYNLREDPEERNDLASSNPKMVKYLLQRLLSYQNRYVLPDVPKDDPAGSPSNFNSIWTPGWC